MAEEAAVITGDIISSSAISTRQRKKLLTLLKEVNAKAVAILPDYKPEFFQGDSFQGYSTASIKTSLKASLFIMLQMMSNDFGVRISTGIGEIDFATGESLTSDGTAIQLSGRNMESLKKTDNLIALGWANPNKSAEWQVHAASLNFLLKRCTALQAAAIAQMLLNKTQQEAAETLAVKQPAIQQRLQAAGWPLMETIIGRFESQF
jgi:hypothetical protein